MKKRLLKEYLKNFIISDFIFQRIILIAINYQFEVINQNIQILKQII
jgi:hypothetical protein